MVEHGGGRGRIEGGAVRGDKLGRRSEEGAVREGALEKECEGSEGMLRQWGKEQ